MYDILFVHPPALLCPKSKYSGFLDSETGYGNQFPSFPVGLLNLADKLDDAGYKVRILNLASYFAQKKPDIGRILKKYPARIFAISLHWVVHADSAMRIARLLKEIYPDSKIILGGLSATYFRNEIMQHKSVDAIILGECDDAILPIVRYLIGRSSSFPTNLFQRGHRYEIACPLGDDFDFTRYDLVIGKENDYSRRRANIPMLRGCRMNCAFCGGSNYSYSRNFGRQSVSHPDIKSIVEQIGLLKDQGRDYIYLYGDLRMLPPKDLSLFFRQLKAARLDVVLRSELFFPISTDYLRSWKASHHDVGFSLSPETSNEKLRIRLGRIYTNSQIIKQVKLLASNRIHQTYFFMSPLPFQTLADLHDTLSFMDSLYEVAAPFKRHFVGNPLYSTMCYMLTPDPGSRMFEHPKSFGLEIFFKKLSDISSAIRKSSHWSDLIGFQTSVLKKPDIVKLIYVASLEKLNMHLNHNDISKEQFKRDYLSLKADMGFRRRFLS